MDYTDEDVEKLLEKEKPPFILYFKVFFLLALISFGMIFFNNAAKNSEPIAGNSNSKTIEAILGTKDRLLGNEKIKEVSGQVQDKGILTALNSVKEDIQDEATKAADMTIDKTTDSTVDYIYDKTIVQVIEKMIQSLPEKQRTQFIEKMCQE